MRESNVSDAAIVTAFAHANFGGADKRELLSASLMKSMLGYYSGHTITVIMAELGLISQKTGKVTAKGRDYLRHAFHHILKNGG